MVLPNPNMMPPMPPMGATSPMPVGPPGAPPGMPPMDPAMMAMGAMPPTGLPGFPPGVIPDPNYAGSPANLQARMMLAMQDPDVMTAMLREMLKDVDPDPGPKRPKFYKKDNYPRPTIANIITRADSDRQAHRLLIERMRRDRDRIRMAVVGVFGPDYNPDIESKFRDASLALDVQLIVSILAACDFIFTKQAKKLGQAEDAQNIENLCYAMFEQWASDHHRRHGTDLKTDLVKIALWAGHLVCRVLPAYDIDDCEIPAQIDLLDPASVFVTRDGYGIEAVTRIYQQSIGELCQGFGLSPSKRKRLFSLKKEKNGQNVGTKSITDTVEVIEYWDRRFFALVVDGEGIIGPVEHDRGRVPFVMTRSGVGDAGPVHENNLNAGIGLTQMAAQLDLASKGQSHIQLIQYTHEQREALMGVVMTEIDKIRNPPRTFEQASTRYGQSPAITNAPGGISMLAMGEEREIPMGQDPRFQLMGPVMSNVNEAAQMGRMSPADYGLVPGSQSSGTVIEGLSESSKDKLNLWKIMIQNHLTGVMEEFLCNIRDNGRLLGKDNKRGEPLMVEKVYPSEGEDGYFEFDYRVLHDDNCRIRVQMTSLRFQNLGALANSVQMWQNIGLMTDEDALNMRGVRDPHAYKRQIEIDSFRKTPEFQKARLIEWMKKEGMTEELPTVLYLMATNGGQGSPPPQAPPGALPGNGGGPPTVGMPGAPGQEGGRPPQLPGPTPMMQGQG